jgi:hypothetical protein
LNPTATLLRWYRQTTSDQTSEDGTYTADEVLDLLHPDSHGDPDRVEAVRGVASQPGAWQHHLTKQQRADIGDLADRLPSLVFHHTLGRSLAELVIRYGGWSTHRYDRALEVACTCIANQLNQSARLAA